MQELTLKRLSRIAWCEETLVAQRKHADYQSENKKNKKNTLFRKPVIDIINVNIKRLFTAKRLEVELPVRDFEEVLYLKEPQNCMIGSNITAVLLKGWILKIGGVSSAIFGIGILSRQRDSLSPVYGNFL